MKKLIIAEPGLWRRNNGEVVPLPTMLFPHLVHAHRIVIEKLVEAQRTRDRMVKLQAQYATADVPAARKARAEVDALVTALEKKRDELNAEIDRRPATAAP